MPDRLTADQWSTYWQGGALHSLPGLFEENYEGPIADFWHSVFNQLPANARILDLGTGNGALALLARHYSDENALEFEITGIDYANIQPASRSSGWVKEPASRITFLPHRRMEETGLPGGHFHLVMSQFSFEYADREAAIAELGRLLRPEDGVFAAVLHHENSRILQQARDLERQILLCNRSGLVPLTRRIIEHRDLSESPASRKTRRELARLSQEFNERMQRLAQSSTAFTDPAHLRGFQQTLGNLLSSAPGNASTRLQMLKRFEHEIRLYRLRLEDLQDAALDPAQLDLLSTQMERPGLAIRHLAPLFHGDALIGVSLVAQRTNRTRQE